MRTGDASIMSLSLMPLSLSPLFSLDATTSGEIMMALCEYKRRKTTIVVVIHQPRPEIFYSFDEVCLLGAGGRLVYFGPPASAVPYFGDLGYIMPSNMNPADFYMDILEGQVLPDYSASLVSADGKTVREEARGNLRMMLTKQASVIITEATSAVERKSALARLFAYWDMHGSAKMAQPTSPPTGSYQPRSLVGLFVQTMMCANRSALQQWRNNSVMFLDVALVCLTGSLVGFMFKNSSLGKVVGVSFLISLCSSTTAVQQSLRVFGPTKLVFLRESASGLSWAAFFIGKNIAALFTLFLMPFLFSTFYWSIAYPTGSFATYYTILLLNQFAWTGVGQLVSLLLPPEKAQLGGVVLTLAVHLVSGSNPSLRELDDIGMVAIADLSIARYGLEGKFSVDQQ